MDKGHQVSWVGFWKDREHLLPEGADLIRLPDGIYENLYGGFIEESQRMRGLESVSFLWKRFLIPLASRMFSSVERVVCQDDPHVLIVDQQAIAGALVARKHARPFATFVTSAPGAFVDPVPQLLRLSTFIDEQLASLQQKFSIPSVLRPDFSDQLVCVFSTREFVGEGRFPDNIHFVGPSISARQDDTPFEWDRLTDDPKVLVSLGTVNAERGRRFYKTVVDALADEELQVIMVAPRELVQEIPKNFILADYVPQLRLLRHVDVVVCHAGQNTVSESLACGVPLVVAPIRDDQPLVASQVEACGVGIRLKFGRLKAVALRDAIRRLLEDSTYRDAVKRIQASFERAGGAEKTAALLETLLEPRS